MKALSWLFLFSITCRADAAVTTFTNPVLAGDYPDPSVIRVGTDYWATATSSEWGPQFPLLRSSDLVNWEITGSVFATRPAWAAGNFWAPEISEWRGRYYIYYVARRKGGPLSVACASADKPGGPYTDHGPFISQSAGSIDPVPVTDEKGERWLVWKEDGNSRRLPTILWTQRLDDDGTHVVGQPREILRNDQPWEGAVVEGPFLLRRGDYFYLFYAGNGCCGRNCAYAVGVARSKTLLGPWKKHAANPILAENAAWKCPGHGSVVIDERGRYWLLYHAYDPRSFVYTGREILVDEIKFDQDGWPAINGGNGPGATASSPFATVQRHSEFKFLDDFTGPALRPGWQWPQENQPVTRSDHGQLVLAPASGQGSNPIGAVLARCTTSGDYQAETIIDLASLKPGAIAGLSAFGDPANAMGLAVVRDGLLVWQQQKNKFQTNVFEKSLNGKVAHLRMNVAGGNRFQFSISPDGKAWRAVGQSTEGGYLPPWDRSVRVALTVGGVAGAEGKFDLLRITSSAGAAP
ncbi:MAG: xylan 1,4-beta-xylosidase [Verrucomicrobiota bacterium]